jgi:hypothetical protein
LKLWEYFEVAIEAHYYRAKYLKLELKLQAQNFVDRRNLSLALNLEPSLNFSPLENDLNKNLQERCFEGAENM